MNKVLTVVFDTGEEDFDSVYAAAIDSLHKLGHTVREIRLADDTGETKIPLNTVEGVTVPLPVTEDNPTGQPAEPEPAPEETVPSEPEEPVDPTSPPVDTDPSTPDAP